MIKASVCVFSFAFRLWLYTASIFLLYGDGGHTFRAVQAAGTEAAGAPTASQSINGAIGGVTSGVPSTIFFNETRVLSCNAKEKTPGYITTAFLFNSPYTFGCLSNDTSSYYLSVALSSINFPNTPVWLANRYRPVKENASLSLTPQGSLLLQDSDGTHVWSGGQHGSSNSAGLTLTAEGNLVFFDEQNSVLWESFSEPVDLLVPGQFLNPGGVLVAGFSSHVVPTGTFMAVMNPGGLIFYENSTSQPLPYYALRYPLIPTNSTDVLTSPCNHTQLQVTNLALTQVQLSYTPTCQAADLNISFGSPVVFIRLEPNGVLKGYYPDHKPSYDVLQNSSKGLCTFPNACGPYGICEDSQQCVCPGNDSSAQYFTEQSIQEFLLTSTSCIPRVQPLGCQVGSATQDHHFLDIPEVDYFANDNINPTLLADTFELCKAACSSKCSCQAAFWRMESKQCFLHESVMSMIRVETDDYMGAIKLQKESSSKKNSEMGLIVGISIVSLISIFFFGVWYYYHKKKRGRHRTLTKDDDDLLSSLPGQPKRFSFKELQAATWEFSQKLGVGGFGSVYKGVFPDGSNVAVKQLESTTRFTQGMKEFRNEVIALSNINHQNLVHLRGFCADGEHRLLVYEYVPNGSLDVWLFRKGVERPGPILDWKTRLSIAVHTARGLFFLHEQCRNRIVHLDIKPQNILLDEQFVPKLSDFGLSRLINEDKDSAVSRMRGTPGYMAPECLILTDATEKSDVYSFGMVLLEIVSGRKNVDVSRLVVHGDGEGWYFPALAARKFKEGNVLDIIDKSLGQLGSDDMAEATRVIKIAFWCIQDDPSLRPTMGNALLMLEGYSKVGEPPLSYNFGMRFHISSSLSANSRAPQNVVSSPKENGDHYHQQDGSEAKTKDQNQEGKAESIGVPSPYASPLSSHLTSSRASPVRQLSMHRSFPSSDFQASPRLSPPPNMSSPRVSPPHRSFPPNVSSPRISLPPLSPRPNVASPCISPRSSHRNSPHHPSPISSPHRASPLPTSPLSHYSQSPFRDTQSTHPSPASHSPMASPRHI